MLWLSQEKRNPVWQDKWVRSGSRVSIRTELPSLTGIWTPVTVNGLRITMTQRLPQFLTWLDTVKSTGGCHASLTRVQDNISLFCLAGIHPKLARDLRLQLEHQPPLLPFTSYLTRFYISSLAYGTLRAEVAVHWTLASPLDLSGRRVLPFLGVLISQDDKSPTTTT